MSLTGTFNGVPLPGSNSLFNSKFDEVKSMKPQPASTTGTGHVIIFAKV